MADTKNVLTPEELEALSSGIEDGSIESDTGINSDIEAVKHDLASEDSSLGMNLSAVNLINERFVRFLKNGISDVLRTSAKVTAEGVAVMTYEEYIWITSANCIKHCDIASLDRTLSNRN